MKKGTALGLVLVVFLVGLASGLLGGRLWHRAHPSSHHLDGSAYKGPPRLRAYLRNFDLELTDEQQQRVEAILDRRHAELEQIHRRLRPEVEAVLERMHSDVEELLDPVQLERYRKQRARRLERRLRHRDGHTGKHAPHHRLKPPAEGGDPPAPEESPRDSGLVD